MDDDTLFKRFQALARMHDPWRQHLAGLDDHSPGFRLHLAIFVEPYLTLLLQGTKTVESRFSRRRSAPFGRVANGDIILLKHAGGPVVGLCRVRRVWSYHLTPNRLNRIQHRFSRRLGVKDHAFWTERQECSYATLIDVENVTTLPPVFLRKRDRRGWVTLRDAPIQLCLS